MNAKIVYGFENTHAMFYYPNISGLLDHGGMRLFPVSVFIVY